ncbi:hypothetical protein PAXRUDRAFT_375871 [Paxillus rubicundulus Ve08.2h10]|uniref:Uncharacterized protein n=1 Tax=Paxillus rubicundulus Ve08.2h10 TaxID=930991 RepID=A0A0D0C2Z9_9AGAM|nr:hypothetical protein PAXRUDRAFT_375871 [Paxillus rubicundulus Ve08.2h10]
MPVDSVDGCNSNPTPLCQSVYIFSFTFSHPTFPPRSHHITRLSPHLPNLSHCMVCSTPPSFSFKSHCSINTTLTLYFYTPLLA